jgi:Flp pilus assembly protein TadD
VVPPRTRVVAIAGAAIVVIGVTLNLNQLAADVYHKEGTSLDAQGNFANSAHAYQEAIALAPQQDYYYLFLGRAYLELAKQAPKTPLSPPFSPTLDNALTVPPATIEQMGQIDALRSAEVVLERARYLAPLNPDHYANLARLYRLWGETIDPSKLADSSHYSRLATTLSPHSAQLFDEWALTLLAEGKLPEALVEARTAAALDPQYAVTHVVLGDVYLNQHQVSDALAQHFQALALDPTALSDSSFEARVQAYVAAGQGRALADRYGALLQSHPSRPVRLAYAYLLTQTGQTALALPQFQILVQQDPTDWLAQRDLAIADEQLGHRTGARAAAQAALQAAPADQRSSIQSLLTSLGAS